MGTTNTAERLDTLEFYMKELSYQSMRTEMELATLSREMREFKDEMKEFKVEMKVFKDEITDFKDEMRGFKDEMIDFKDEMKGFKDEMTDYKEENRLAIKEMNQRWGNLANKMGTLVEDIVAPNIPRVAHELFGREGEADFFAVRIRKQVNGQRREFDALAVFGDLVLLNETKSTLDDQGVNALLDAMAAFPLYFPEYREHRLVGLAASLYVNPSVVDYCSSKGVLMMGVGDTCMEVLNPRVVAG